MNDNLCIDFLPIIDAEKPDASFMKESIDLYCEAENAKIIDESIKDVISGFMKKLKSGTKAVWKKVQGAASKIISTVSHVKAGRKAQNESLTYVDEAIDAIFGVPEDGDGKTGADFVKGFDIACEVILRNLGSYQAVIDAAMKALKDISNSKDVKTAIDQFNKSCDDNAKRINDNVKVLRKKYNIPEMTKDGRKVSQLAYACKMMSPEAANDLTDKDIAELTKLIKGKWHEICVAYDKAWDTGIVKDNPLAKEFKRIGNSIPADQVSYIMAIGREMSFVSEDWDYTQNDIQYVYSRLGYAVNASQKSNQSATNESVEARNIYYRLSDSETYRYARQISQVNGAPLESNITRMVRNGHGFTFVGINDLDKTVLYELFESNQYFNVNVSGAKKAMRNLLASGKVQMVFSDVCKVATSIPFVVATGEHPRIFVNISDFVSTNELGKYVVGQARNMNGLMAILFAACVAYAIMTHYHVLNPEVGDPIVLMHAYMLTAVLDRMVHMDPLMRDKIRYLCTEFALIQMYGTDRGNKLFQRFRQKYFPKLSPMIMDSVDAQFSLDSFDSLSTLLNEMVQNYPSMKKVDYRSVWFSWHKRYGSSTALSIDYIGYHIYTLSMLLYESPLINRLALDPMLKSARGEGALRSLQMMIASVG